VRPCSTAAPIAARWFGASYPATPNSILHLHQCATGSTAPDRRSRFAVAQGQRWLDVGFDMRRTGLRPLRIGNIDGALFGNAREVPSRSGNLGAPSWRSCDACSAAGPGARLQSSADTRELEALRREYRDNYHGQPACTSFSSPSGSTGRPKSAGQDGLSPSAQTSPGPRLRATTDEFAHQGWAAYAGARCAMTFFR